MNTLEKYNKLRQEGLNKYSSWCLYNIESDYLTKPDVTQLSFDSYNKMIKEHPKSIDKLLNTDVMSVALNWGDLGIPSNNWENFHYDSKNAFTSTNPIIYLPFISIRTIMEGSYMTDILKKFPQSDSKGINVNSVKRNPEKALESAKLFQRELDILKPKVIIFIGEVSRRIFNYFVKEGLVVLPNTVVVGHIYHYSMISYENCIVNRQNLLRIENTFRNLNNIPPIEQDRTQPLVDRVIVHRNKIIKEENIKRAAYNKKQPNKDKHKKIQTPINMVNVKTKPLLKSKVAIYK